MTRRLPHIVCYAPYTNWSIHGARQVTILQALRLRGCSVSYVACDAVYPICDMTQPANGAAIAPGPEACLVCQSSVTARLAAWGMPYRWLGRWLRTEDFKTAKAWIAQLSPAQFAEAQYHSTEHNEVWDVGAWVKSSVHTQLRHNVLDLTDPAVSAAYATYLESGLLACIALSRLFDQEKPAAQLLFNGRMSSTRIALELAKTRGIRTICEERSAVAGRLMLYDNGHCLDLSGMDALWHDWKDIPLNAAEIADTAALLEDRWHGRSTDVSVFSKGLEDRQRVRERLNLDPAKPLWVLFTSSLDESVDEPRFAGIFPTQNAWIDATVTYAAKHPDLQLVIRVHPNSGSSKSLGHNPQDGLYYGALAKRLPPNVRLVAADDNTSSYTLAAMADFGLIWYSTIGVEMAAMGRPVLRVGASWLADCDFLLWAPDEAQYVQRLDAARVTAPKATPADTAGAWRFTYMWYYRQSIPFPLVAQPQWYAGEPTYKTPEALAPGKDAHLDRICDIFMSGAPLHGKAEMRAASVAAEEAATIGKHIAPFARHGANP